MHGTSFLQQLRQRRNADAAHYIDKKQVARLLDDLFAFLFLPSGIGLQELYEEQLHLQRRLAVLLHLAGDQPGMVAADAKGFFDVLPDLYTLLIADAEAILAFDPAAGSLQEVIYAYPGFYATFVYRIAHHLHQLGIPSLPRMLSEHAHSHTGIDIHPAAQIGSSFFIDHGTGVVIGASAIIGNHVKIYQGVTLGALSVAKDLADVKRHPTIGDHVTIYSGATILGGNTVVGRNSIIGGNVWLTHSVEPDSVVYSRNNIVVRSNHVFPDAIDFVI
ncbi:serine acetyltransferase [Rurimicrobium arvi]|uniref:Serine O-acetyltransferase n=1 Tax=Rurimicrobium arvi TaxID=2049916 RepID=A0ABP8N1F7_9BACT